MWKPANLAWNGTRAFALVLLAVALTDCGGRPQRAEAQAEQPTPPKFDPANSHTIRVSFNYDFKKTPACSPEEKAKTCVKQFNVYDISGGTYKLFSVPVPEHAVGLVKGIQGKSPERQFLPGTHFIAVTAENAAGVESDVNSAKVTVQVKRKSPPDAAAAPKK